MENSNTNINIKSNKKSELLQEDFSHSGTGVIKYEFDCFEFDDLRIKYKLRKIASGKTELEKALKIMRHFSPRIKHFSEYNNFISENSLDLLEYSLDNDDNGINCLAKSKIFTEMLLAIGIKARRVSFRPKDPLIMENHVVTEIYDYDFDKWVMLDFSNNMYYINENFIPLSLYEIRTMIASDRGIIPVFSQQIDENEFKERADYFYNYYSELLYFFTYDEYSTFGEKGGTLYLAPEQIDIQKYFEIHFENKKLLYPADLESIGNRYDKMKQNGFNMVKFSSIHRVESFDLILKDKVIIDIYTEIGKNKIFWSKHGLTHINNVLKNIYTLCDMLHTDDYDRNLCLIAGVLHDVGSIDGKQGHAKRSAEFAEEYLNTHTFLTKQDIRNVVNAVEGHSSPGSNKDLISGILILADKCDITRTRITPEGIKQLGNRQYKNIKKVEIYAENNKIFIKIIINSKFNKQEFLEYYFTKTLVRATKYLAGSVGMEYDVLLSDESILKYFSDEN